MEFNSYSLHSRILCPEQKAIAVMYRPDQRDIVGTWPQMMGNVQDIDRLCEWIQPLLKERGRFGKWSEAISYARPEGPREEQHLPIIILRSSDDLWESTERSQTTALADDNICRRTNNISCGCRRFREKSQPDDRISHFIRSTIVFYIKTKQLVTFGLTLLVLINTCRRSA